MIVPFDYREPGPERRIKKINALVNKLEARTRNIRNMIDNSIMTPDEKNKLRNKLKDII